MEGDKNQTVQRIVDKLSDTTLDPTSIGLLDSVRTSIQMIQNVSATSKSAAFDEETKKMIFGLSHQIERWLLMERTRTETTRELLNELKSALGIPPQQPETRQVSNASQVPGESSKIPGDGEIEEVSKKLQMMSMSSYTLCEDSSDAPSTNASISTNTNEESLSVFDQDLSGQPRNGPLKPFAEPEGGMRNPGIGGGSSDNKFQLWMKQNPHVELVGAEYISKVTPKKKPKSNRYGCTLCKNLAPTTSRGIFTHLIEKKHRKKCECAKTLPIFENNPIAWKQWSSGKPSIPSNITVLRRSATLNDWIAANKHIPIVFCAHIAFGEDVKMPKKPDEYTCKLCRAKPTSVPDVVAHLRSKKHIRGVLERNRTAMSEPVKAEVKIHSDPCVAAVKVVDKSESKPKAQSSYTCTVCKTKPTEPNQMFAHLLGMKHRKLCRCNLPQFDSDSVRDAWASITTPPDLYHRFNTPLDREADLRSWIAANSSFPVVYCEHIEEHAK